MERRVFLQGVIGAGLLGTGSCSSSNGTPSSGATTASGPGSAPAAGDARTRPNIVVIYLDDMRYDGLDFMPKSRSLFDHEFTQARTNGGACTDARLGLFTGTYILHHPWDIWKTNADHDASKTWGPWMRAAGYRTAMFGKYISTEGWPFGVVDGWDVWRSYVEGAHRDEGFEIDLGTTPLDPITPDGLNLDYMMGELIEFARTTKEQPFFASWNPQHPHQNYDGGFNVQPEYVGAWSDLPSPVPVDEDITGKPAWVQALDPITPEQAADLRRAQQGKAQALSGVDDAIAEFFTALDDAGIRDDTIVILSSDQGVHYGEHRWGAALGVAAGVQKGTLYDPVVRVPMLATGPGFPPGVTTIPVTQSDITATAVAAAGAPTSHRLDGMDLRSIVENPLPHTQRALLLQSVVPFSPVPDHASIVTGPDHSTYPLRKLGRLATGEVELYDLGTDPGEFVNLASDANHRTERAALEAALDELLSK